MRGLDCLRRAALLGVCLLVGLAAFAQPDRTRITDTIYLADGKPFNGYVQLEWQSFVSSKAPIAPQSQLIRVVDGAFSVELTPTKNLGYTAYYRVRYFRRGRVEYIEYWDIPASASPLTIAGVRMEGAPAPGSGGGGTGGGGVSLPIPQEDVNGLTEDLADRPVKGPNFLPSRTVYVNPEGALEAISGAPTDCVRVDGTSAPCGTSASFEVDAATPAGVVNGLNQQFTLAGIPTPPSSLQVFRNGVLQRLGLDYTVSGALITFTFGSIPQPDDVLLTYYRTQNPVGAPTTGAGLLPQVLCNLSGQSTSSLTLTELGTCTLGGTLLEPGDRLEVLFDWSLTGPVPDGTEIQLQWAGLPIMTRTFSGFDLTGSGTARIAAGSSTTQFSVQTFGASSFLQTSTGTLTVPQSAFTVRLLGRVESNEEAEITLTNFAVVRYPKVVGQ